jgi:PAS domain S-box-containing protein
VVSVTLDDETRLRLLASLHDAYAYVDMNGNLLDCNNHFCSITGYAKQELLNLTFRDLTPIKWHSVESKIIEEHVSQHGYSPVYEKEYIHRNGNIFPVEIRTFLLRTTTGKPQGMWALVRDISERKSTEEKLMNAKETAERANHAKGAFLAQVSHDIRTLLSGLTGAHELLAVTKLNRKQVGLLKTAVHSLDCLVSLMNSVLDLSKIEAGMLRLNHSEFNLNSLVHNIAECHAPKFATKKVSFRVCADDNLSTNLVGDSQRLVQVLNNLLDNAAKFTSSGSVHLKVQEIARSENDCTIQFSVTDSGIGIEENRLENIFDPFIQAANNTSAKFGGTGLGLSISKQIVKILGGQIWAESILGSGSTFHFTAKLKRLSASPS